MKKEYLLKGKTKEEREMLKQSYIRKYRNHIKYFINHPTMEASCFASDIELVLLDVFKMTTEEIEEIEMSCY